MERIANVGLALLAVVVVALSGWVLTHKDATHASRPPAVVVTSPATTSASSETVSPSVSTSAAPRQVVAFLGDDWTSGVGATRPAKRFSSLLCAELHADEVNLGADGTGYAKSAAGAHGYRSRVAAIVAAHPDVVVVTGGRNDRSDDLATATDQITRLFAALHAQLPNARLVAVRPFWGDSDPPVELTDLATAVRTAVETVHGTYLDLPDPIHGHPEYMADAADPNNRGYAAIAAALRSPLATALGHG